MSKRSRAQPGQALRGSTDLHAWSDSAAYLVRRRDKLILSIEHRSAPAPEPFAINLITDEDGSAYLCAVDHDGSAHVPQHPLVEHVRRLLADHRAPLTRAAIRRELRVNNQRLGDALLRLEHDQIAERTPDGWRLRTGQRQLVL